MNLLFKMANILWPKYEHKCDVCSTAKVTVPNHICYINCDKHAIYSVTPPQRIGLPEVSTCFN